MTEVRWLEPILSSRGFWGAATLMALIVLRTLVERGFDLTLRFTVSPQAAAAKRPQLGVRSRDT